MSQLQHPPSCFSLIHPANSGAINCWGDGSVCCLLSQRRVSSARLPLCYTTLYFYWVHVFVNRNTTGLLSPNSVSIIGQFLTSLHALCAFFLSSHYLLCKDVLRVAQPSLRITFYSLVFLKKMKYEVPVWVLFFSLALKILRYIHCVTIEIYLGTDLSMLLQRSCISGQAR